MWLAHEEDDLLPEGVYGKMIESYREDLMNALNLNELRMLVDDCYIRFKKMETPLSYTLARDSEQAGWWQKSGDS